MIILDTHIAIWLSAGELQRFSPRVRKILDHDEELAVTPTSMLEFEFLYEIGRIKENAKTLFEKLARSFGIEALNGNYLEISKVAQSETWTRDPFDRMLVAQARIEKIGIISSDRKIAKNYSKTIFN